MGKEKKKEKEEVDARVEVSEDAMLTIPNSSPDSSYTIIEQADSQGVFR